MVTVATPVALSMEVNTRSSDTVVDREREATCCCIRGNVAMTTRLAVKDRKLRHNMVNDDGVSYNDLTKKDARYQHKRETSE